MLDLFINTMITAALLSPASLIDEPFQNNYEVIEIEKIIIENQLDHISIYGEVTITKDKEGLQKALLLRQNLTSIIRELEKQTATIPILQPTAKKHQPNKEKHTMPLNFWTAQYRYPGPNRLDISVKGNDPFGKLFAPTWEMLTEYKTNPNRNQAEQIYIAAYHQLIHKNFKYLDQLLTFNEVVLVCFCKYGDFCHRNLLTRYLIVLGAEYRGEILDFSPWTNTLPTIPTFKGEYDWLSNFYYSPFVYQGILYPTNEHFYQAWKFPADARQMIAALDSPGKAKRIGRKAPLCWNWDAIKVEVMKTGLLEKFKNPELAEKLIATGERVLIEGNYWHDNFWGKCTCDKCKNIKAQNMLGKLLMEIRNQLSGRESP